MMNIVDKKELWTFHKVTNAKLCDLIGVPGNNLNLSKGCK